MEKPTFQTKKEQEMEKPYFQTKQEQEMEKPLLLSPNLPKYKP